MCLPRSNISQELFVIPSEAVSASVLPAVSALFNVTKHNVPEGVSVALPSLMVCLS